LRGAKPRGNPYLTSPHPHKTEKSPSFSSTGLFRVILKNKKLHSAGDLAAAQAASAGVDVLGASVHDGLDALHVGLPHTIGTSVRVADLDAESNILLAKLTLCH